MSSKVELELMKAPNGHKFVKLTVFGILRPTFGATVNIIAANTNASAIAVAACACAEHLGQKYGEPMDGAAVMKAAVELYEDLYRQHGPRAHETDFEVDVPVFFDA